MRNEEGAMKRATWIWYPGDFEVWLGNIFNNRRTERGAMFPPFWKQDSHWPTVEFSTTVELTDDEDVAIAAEGRYNLAVDGQLQRPCFTMPAQQGVHSSPTMTIPKGRHRLSIKVWNQATPPALFIDGPTVKTDATWLVTYEDKIWVDENGMAHGSGIYVPAASWHFYSIDTPPSAYHLERREQCPVALSSTGGMAAPSAASPSDALYDFGRETFGYLKLKGLKGTVRIYYGESREEALDKEHCETLDVLHSPVCCDMMADSKAFRYVLIERVGDSSYDAVLMDYEYAPFDADRSGSFRCSDPLLNKIWEVSAYTLELTTREFFMDGIKRDRWTWSGDAIQSYLMNYYLHFDTDCVKRTIRQLRGKDPVTAHVNTIMDYTFYWFKSVADYYDYTADLDFIREMWPRMVSLMDYVLSRTNGEGLAEGLPDDWLFVDWTDFPMHKRGVLCFEQILFMKALETMARCADLLGQPADLYRCKAGEVRKKTNDLFWSSETHAYVHALERGKEEGGRTGDDHINPQITKFPNMFAILYGLADGQQTEQIMNSVMTNPDIDAITTPYMRFYELETLCRAGHHRLVLNEMRSYWGGMLREGATTFWEKYVPAETGTQHLAMYGRPYGKSLCHAWGASPLYLLGRYYLGVRPTKPGYEAYEVRPQLAGLEWMRGDVPTPFGLIHVEADRHTVTVRSHGGCGTLILGSRRIEIPSHHEISVEYNSPND
ncbi:MAG: alpha-rhamnosidase [Prevotella sp.]|nr:alpha-rhamnosidase [Prevotella sp.]